MVKIRLTRAGAKKRPYYHIIAIDEREPRSGRPLEFLGSYDPRFDPGKIEIELPKVQAWIGKGAQMSPTVRSLVRRASKQQATLADAAAATAGAEG